MTRVPLFMLLMWGLGCNVTLTLKDVKIRGHRYTHETPKHHCYPTNLVNHYFYAMAQRLQPQRRDHCL